MKIDFKTLRFRLEQSPLFPRSRLSRAAWYLLGLDVLLFLLQKILRLFGPHAGDSLSGWISFLTFIVVILFALVGIRWVRQRILWRLRNRLIVTYIFIGVIPAILLITIAFISLYLFAGQFANFVVLSDLNSRLQSLSAANSVVASELARQVAIGKEPPVDFLKDLRLRNERWKNRSVCVWRNEKNVLCEEGISPYPRAANALVRRPNGAFVRDRDQFYLRTSTTVPLAGGNLTFVSSEPLDRTLLGEVASEVGEIVLCDSGLAFQGRNDSSDHLTVNMTSNQNPCLNPISAGTLPPQTRLLDREISFGMPVQFLGWNAGGSLHSVPGITALINTRPSVLYLRLFAALGDYSQFVEIVLVVVGIVFAIIELIALYIGARLTRSITGAVAQLYTATTFVNRGDLSHRIPVQSSDQLASLATSFNAMTASLENLLEEQRDKQRLENELIIAQEVQSQLFPREISQLSSLELHGFCRPARTVSGDYYDFLNVDSDTLIFAVGDVSGKGISAALLMATIHSAVRAYSLEGIPLVRQLMAAGAPHPAAVMPAHLRGAEVSPSSLLSLLNHQLYASTPAEKYATLFLAFYDGRQRRLTYTNGGHLPPLILAEDGSTRRLECGGTVVGLFDEVSYEEAGITLRAGDIFLAYSDGVTEPENDYGEFGEDRLIGLVHENRHQPLSTITEIVTAALDDWIGNREQPDDVTLLLARVR